MGRVGVMNTNVVAFVLAISLWFSRAEVAETDNNMPERFLQSKKNEMDSAHKSQSEPVGVDKARRPPGSQKHQEEKQRRCFHEKSLVDIRHADGDTRSIPISDLKAGMQVFALDWEMGQAYYTEVEYTQARPCPGGMQDFVHIRGLYVSPDHPVLVEEGWIRPRSRSPPVSRTCEYTYVMVLKERHLAVFVGGTPAAPFDDKILNRHQHSKIEYAADKFVWELEEVKKAQGVSTNDIVREADPTEEPPELVVIV